MMGIEYQPIIVNNREPLFGNIRMEYEGKMGFIYNKRCVICKACVMNSTADELVHKEKFNKVLSLGDVVNKLRDMNIKATRYILGHHYLNHLENELKNLYIQQREILKRDKGRKKLDKELGCIVKFPKVSKRFDSLVALKEIYDVLDNKLKIFDKDSNVNDGKDLKLYGLVVDQLRKVASDIARIETDRDYIRKLLMSSFEELIKDLVYRVSNILNYALLGLNVPQEDKRKCMDNVKVEMAKVLQNSLRVLERKFISEG